MKITLLFLLSALTCCFGQAVIQNGTIGQATFGGAAAGGGGACNTVRQTSLAETTADANNLSFGYDPDANQMIAYCFWASNTYTACKAGLTLKKNGTPEYGVKVAIYSDNANAPGTIVGTASDEVAGNSVGTTEGEVLFANLSSSLTSGTKYWLVIYKSSGAFHYYTDTLIWPYASGDVGFTDSYYATSWTTYAGGYRWGKFAIYSN